MIRLATVFSGIGAIEHALDRMGLEHEIVFACDNGDVDILSKKIDDNIDEIKVEIKELKNIVNKENDKEEFSKQLKQCEIKLKKSVDEINNIKEEFFYTKLTDLLKKILKSKIKPTKQKEYKKILQTLEETNKHDENNIFEAVKSIIKILNDY